MVNPRERIVAAFVAALPFIASLFTAGCAPISDLGAVVTEQSTDVDDYNVHIFGRRTGLEPCSMAQVARHTC
jgi:hypothetical protein